MSRPSGLNARQTQGIKAGDLFVLAERFSRYSGPLKATRREMLAECAAAGVPLPPRQLREAANLLLEMGYAITTQIGHGVASTEQEAEREERAIRAPALTMLERARRFRENYTRQEEQRVRESTREKGQLTLEGVNP